MTVTENLIAMRNQFDLASHTLVGCRRVVVFTGAGISTESGIPDFRGPGGVWERYRPIAIQEFLSSHDARREYWRYKRETRSAFARARPNAAHAAIVDLERAGLLVGVVTQNIDGLHQAAGLAADRVVELHGTNAWLACLACGRRYEWEEVDGVEVPACDCGGWLKPATVSFGQALPPEALERAFSWTRSAEICLAVGSSLVVEPAASLPLAAKRCGARLVIVNLEETPHDGFADATIRGAAGEVLPRLVATLVRGAAAPGR